MRVVIVVEGQAEESFVKEVLAPTLWPGVLVDPILLGIPGYKGGRTNYARVKKDVLLRLKQDRSVCCSTMLDFYGLGKGFPGSPAPANLPSIAKAERIEQAFKADICNLIPDFRPDVRFLPYIQLHEYEGLLFSDPLVFAKAINCPSLVAAFLNIRDSFATPEDINDSADGAPSKRVLQLHRRYRKIIDGTIAAQNVGIESMRRECPHFRDWLDRLARLGQA